MANAKANASAGGSPAKYENPMPKTMSGEKMGAYGPNQLKKVPDNTIRSRNMKRQDKNKKPKKHNPY